MKKSDIIMGLLGGTLAVIVTSACFPSETSLEGGKYAGKLEECNRQGKTLCESIACENQERARAGRFPRDVPKHCTGSMPVLTLDAGIKEGGDQ